MQRFRDNLNALVSAELEESGCPSSIRDILEEIAREICADPKDTAPQPAGSDLSPAQYGAVMKPGWDALPEDRKEPFLRDAEWVLDGLFVCSRAWEAWKTGTMTKEDFEFADGDRDIVEQTAFTIYARTRIELAQSGAAAQNEKPLIWEDVLSNFAENGGEE